MKTKIILILSFVIPLIFVLLYMWATATHYVYNDDFMYIKGGFIESYLKGTLNLSELWRPSCNTRGAGYMLLWLADIKWFSMNSRIIILLIPICLLSSSLLIYYDYRKSFVPEISPEFIAATFLMINMIIFNVMQWQGLSYRYSLVFQLPMPLIIASFISLELYLTKGMKYWPLSFILTTLAVLFFGATPIFAFVPALCLTFSVYIIMRYTSLTKDFWVRVFIMIVFLSITAFIYVFGIHHNDYVSDPPFYLMEIIARPFDALQFLLAAFGANIVGHDLFFAYDYFSFNTIVVIGLIVVFLYFLALFLFFKSRMYKHTYLPLFLIMQVGFYLVFMTIGRFGMNKYYGMSPHYTCVSKYGIVAIIWIFIFTLVNYDKLRSLLKITLYAGFTIIFSGLLMTSIETWRMQPERKAEYEPLYDIAMNVDTASDDELWKFEADPEQVRASLRLLRDYKLNLYRSMLPREK